MSAADDKSEVQETLNNFDKLQKNDAGNELFVLATNFLVRAVHWHQQPSHMRSVAGLLPTCALSCVPLGRV